MKIYLAGPYQHKEKITRCAEQLREAGIIVTSSWLEEPHKPSTQLYHLPDNVHAEYAQRDLVDIQSANILLLFTVPASDPPIPRAGRHVEFGYALGLGLPIYVVGGEKENIFHYLPQIRHFETWDDALAELIKNSVEVMGR